MVAEPEVAEPVEASKHRGSRLFVRVPRDCAALVSGYYSDVPSGRGFAPTTASRLTPALRHCEERSNPEKKPK